MEDMRIPLPSSLELWTKYNLFATFFYTSNPLLKSMINGELWYRNELLRLDEYKYNTYLKKYIAIL